jgi:outer membrane protein
MKKIITILWIPKLLAMTLLLASCGNAVTTTENKSDDTQQVVTAGQETVATKTSDIAYIRVDSIVQRYDYYHDLLREFELKVKKKEQEFKSKKDALEADAKVFQEKFDKMLLTQSESDEQRDRLLQRNEELMSVERPKIMQELGEEEAVMNRKVVDAIYRYVEKYNAEKKYSLILNAATVVTGNPAMDITSEILKGLNQEYIANKRK